MRRKMKKTAAVMLVFMMLFALIADKGISVQAEESIITEGEPETIEDSDKQFIRLDGTEIDNIKALVLADPGNVEIKDWKRYTGEMDITSTNLGNMSDMLNAVAGASEITGDDVWDGSRKYEHNLNDSGYLKDGQITAVGNILYDSATWSTRQETHYRINRFKGNFDISDIEGYTGQDKDLNEIIDRLGFTVGSVTGKGEIFVNDDIYVFVYPSNVTLTSENYTDYFAFWTGTRMNKNPDTTFAGYKGTKIVTVAGTQNGGLSQLTNGWSVEPVIDNAGGIILNEYYTNNVTEFTIDIFTDDYQTGGGVYRPVIIAEPIKRYPFQFKKVDSLDPTIGLEGVEFVLDGAGRVYHLISDEHGLVEKLIPAGEYTLTETKVPEGYNDSGKSWTVVMNENGSYSITENGGSALTKGKDDLYHIANTPKIFNLIISKVVDGETDIADSNKGFNFSISTTRDCIEPDDNIEGGDGSYAVTLKDGEAATLTLPYGTNYTVTEEDYSNQSYETTVESNSAYTVEGNTVTGSIQGNVTVPYTNTMLAQTLTVTKTVDGNSDEKNKEFEFDLNVKYADGSNYTDSVFDEDGNYKFILKDGESVEMKLPKNCKYKVSETPDDRYVTTITGNNADGVLDEDKTVNFTNTAKRTLTISKTVEGVFGDKNKEFDFRLSLKKGDPLVNIEHLGYSATTNESVEVSGKNGDYTIKLKDGESIVFTLPYGAKYTLKEEIPDDYVMTNPSVNLAGEKELKVDTVVNVTNTAKVTELILKKDVTGLTGNEEKQFKFTIKLTNPDGSPFEDLDVKGVTHLGKGVYTVQLKDSIDDDRKENSDGIVRFYPLPYGIKYEILEDDYTSYGYKTEYEKNSVGELTDNNIDEPYKVDEGMLSATETSTVTNVALENKLEVSKKVSGDSDAKQKDFKFTLKVIYADGESYHKPLPGTQSVLGSGIYTFTLKHGEKIEFTLPAYCNYVLKEQDYSKNGYTTYYSHSVKNTENKYEEIVSEKSGNTITGTLTGDQKALYLNQEPVNLRITKRVEGNGGDRNDKFEFTLKLEKSGKAIDYTNYNLEGAQITEIEKGVYKILMGHRDSAIFRVPYGTKYEVVEKDYAYKEYVTTVNDEETREASGKLKNTDGETVIKFINTREVAPMIYLAPKTGDGSNMILWTSVLAIAVISIVVINKNRKRR